MKFDLRYRFSVYGLSLSCVCAIVRTVVPVAIERHQPNAKVHYITHCIVVLRATTRAMFLPHNGLECKCPNSFTLN